MAAGNTYTPLATQTLGSATATVTFSSISGSYTDLVLIANFGLTAGDDLWLRFNGDTTAIYSSTRLLGASSSVASTRTTGYTGIQPRTPSNQASTVTSMWRINIMDYANTTTYKTALGRYDFVSVTETNVGLWRSTAAVTSVSVACNASTFVTGSTFTLYGIAAA
jgi:hypothetical protein